MTDHGGHVDMNGSGRSQAAGPLQPLSSASASPGPGSGDGASPHWVQARPVDAADLTASPLRQATRILETESRDLVRTSHAAGVAGASLARIRNLLGDLALQTTPPDAQTDARPGNPAVDRRAILDAIDHAAAQSRFAGQQLFDGSHTLKAGDQTFALPHLSADTLGARTPQTTNHASQPAGGASLRTLAEHQGDAQAAVEAADDEVRKLQEGLLRFQRLGVDQRLGEIKRQIETLRESRDALQTLYEAHMHAQHTRQHLLTQPPAGDALLASHRPADVLAMLTG